MRSHKKDEVYHACRSLEAKDKVVTYVSVGNELEALGYKRGSTSDIGKYLKMYKLEQSMLTTKIDNTLPATAAHFIQEIKKELQALYLAMDPRAAGGYTVPSTKIDMPQNALGQLEKLLQNLGK